MRHGSHSQRNCCFGQSLSHFSLEVQTPLGSSHCSPPVTAAWGWAGGVGQLEGMGCGTLCAPQLSPTPGPAMPSGSTSGFWGGLWGALPAPQTAGRGLERQNNIEMLGVDPKASCMQSKCCPAEVHAPVQGQGGTQESLLSSWSTCPCGHWIQGSYAPWTPPNASPTSWAP